MYSGSVEIAYMIGIGVCFLIVYVLIVAIIGDYKNNKDNDD